MCTDPAIFFQLLIFEHSLMLHVHWDLRCRRTTAAFLRVVVGGANSFKIMISKKKKNRKKQIRNLQNGKSMQNLKASILF